MTQMLPRIVGRGGCSGLGARGPDRTADGTDNADAAAGEQARDGAHLVPLGRTRVVGWAGSARSYERLPRRRISTGAGHIVGPADAPGTGSLGNRSASWASNGGAGSNDTGVVNARRARRRYRSFDTPICFSYAASMRMKCTYNLSSDAIATVRRLVEVDHLATTEDALVEQAIAELDRAVRDVRDARLCGAAKLDAEFQAELARIDVELPTDDLATWE